MGCFLAPTTEAIIVTLIKRHLEKKERTANLDTTDAKKAVSSELALAFSHRLGWLTKLLWGGSFLLAIEHVWHGEVVPWFPFLTAMYSPSDIVPMLKEIATVGVSMAVLTTAVWVVMVLVSVRMERKAKALSSVKEA